MQTEKRKEMCLVENTCADVEQSLDVIPDDVFLLVVEHLEQRGVGERDDAVIRKRKETAWRGVQQTIHCEMIPQRSLRLQDPPADNPESTRSFLRDDSYADNDPSLS